MSGAKKGWKQLLENQISKVSPNMDSDDIELVIEQKKDKIERKIQQPKAQNSLDFYINRLRSDVTFRKPIHLDQDQVVLVSVKGRKNQHERNDRNDNNQAQAVKSAKKWFQLNKKSDPKLVKRNSTNILQKQKQKNQTNQRLIAREREKEKQRQIYKQKQRQKQKQKLRLIKQQRWKQQLQVIHKMNAPRWTEQKSVRSERNKQKYPLSYQSGKQVNYDERSWIDFQKKQKEEALRRQIKTNQARKQEAAKRQEQRRLENQRRYDEIKDLCSAIVGIEPRKRFKPNIQIQDDVRHDVSPALSQIQFEDKNTKEKKDYKNSISIQEQKVQKQKINKSSQLIYETKKQEFQKQRKNQENEKNFSHKNVGLKEYVRLDHSNIPKFLGMILSHDFKQNKQLGDNKRIPNIFKGVNQYIQIFRRLVVNECIGDLRERMKKLQKDEVYPIKVIVKNVKESNEGMGLSEISVKQKVKRSDQTKDEQKKRVTQNKEKRKETTQINKQIKTEGKRQAFLEEKSEQLKNLSLSKYRVGILSSRSRFKLQQYSFPGSKSRRYCFLVLLSTPQTKQQFGDDVKMNAWIKWHELQMIFKLTQTRQAYFYDLEKLTTHLREYQAISNLSYSQLAPLVLNPTIIVNDSLNYVHRRECLENILQNLKSIFNETQYESIRNMVLRVKGIVMLQGPPGTGKTSTLMGLLSAQYEYQQKAGDRSKIMVCAPSNAAVDHITKRLIQEGLIDGEGEIVHPQILRTGIVQTEDKVVKNVSLDHLCDQLMLAMRQESLKDMKMTTPEIKDRIINLQRTLVILNQKRKISMNSEEAAKLEREISEIRIQSKKYQSMMYEFRKQKIIGKRSYIQFENELFSKAQIILTTLSSSGSDKIQRIRGEVGCLIVDEAAQATEPNLLIALQTGVEKILMIGDPYQLPATCISQDANRTLFNRSLFQRFIDSGIQPYFLTKQYRMAPLIRMFPSNQFYHGRLKDGETILERGMLPSLQNFFQRNVIFLDVKYGEERKIQSSSSNIGEAKIIQLLIKRLMKQDVQIGIITPYQAQKKIITKGLNSNVNMECQIMVNTVDSFQGQEKDVILVSTVRSNRQSNLGFLMDERRINVTLTRSKYLLIIVGNGDTLGSNEVWNNFLEFVENQKCYYEIHKETDSDKILQKMFQGFNNKQVKRMRHNHLSRDIRRIGKVDQSHDNHEHQESQKINKYAKNAAQSREIILLNREKEKELIQFEKAQQRVRELQRRLKNDKQADSFFAQLR